MCSALFVRWDRDISETLPVVGEISSRYYRHVIEILSRYYWDIVSVHIGLVTVKIRSNHIFEQLHVKLFLYCSSCLLYISASKYSRTWSPTGSTAALMLVRSTLPSARIHYTLALGASDSGFVRRFRQRGICKARARSSAELPAARWIHR